ncbi:hypothetical protein OROMI_007503 [Orobanche minor]
MENNDGSELIICHYGFVGARLTSWTDKHPKRRVKIECHVSIGFGLTQRSIEIILGLLRWVNGNEARVSALEEENARLRAQNSHRQSMLAQNSHFAASSSGGGIAGEDVKNEINAPSVRVEELRIRVRIN